MIFKSFLMGGFECSTHYVPRHKSLGRFSGRRLDVIAATRHDEFVLQDYARLHEVGIRTARDGVRWHLIETTPGRYDFSSLVPMLRAARETKTQIIWDLLHYGWPDGLDVWSAAFVDRFARFARAVAGVILGETGGPIYVTPVNEISFVSWAGGDAGTLNPFANGRGFELKVQLARAAIAATLAVREMNPDARICHVDPINHIVAEPDQPEHVLAAEACRQAQFQAWDMISGKLHPELGGRTEYLDIIGVNYYSNNQWTYQDPNLPPSSRRKTNLLRPTNPLNRPVREILREMYERYHRPLFIAETGMEGTARPSWLRYIGQEARAVMASGVPLEGLCFYPILNHPGWIDDRHCHNGLWDYADENGYRPIYEPLAREFVYQQRLLDSLRQGLPAAEEILNLEEIDEAACHVDSAADKLRDLLEHVE
jgi:polysaccharide biosynthesis protein PelF